jgi:hypothetical protein
MSSTIKTLVSDASVDEFINSIDDEVKRSDSFQLLALYEKVTGEPAKLWGPSIIGFGKYHCKSERSRQEGDWPLAAFSPRKQNMTFYIDLGTHSYTDLLQKLGKHKVSKACLYINTLSDVDEAVLSELISRSYLKAKEQLTSV